MKIRPLHDRLIVERREEDEKSPGGIVIPDAAKEKPVLGKVISVGNGKVLEDGSLRKLAVKAKDTVLFAKYAGTEVRLDGKDFLVLREDDVIAVLDK